MPLEGLPDGLDVVRIGAVASPDEYLLILGAGGHYFLRNDPQNANNPGVVVTAAKGYSIINGKIAQLFDSPKSYTVEVNNSIEEANLLQVVTPSGQSKITASLDAKQS